MNNKDTERSEFDEFFGKNCLCIQNGCDNNGTIAEESYEQGWEAVQCQYCYEIRFPLREKLYNWHKEQIRLANLGLINELMLYRNEEISSVLMDKFKQLK